MKPEHRRLSPLHNIVSDFAERCGMLLVWQPTAMRNPGAMREDVLPVAAGATAMISIGQEHTGYEANELV